MRGCDGKKATAKLDIGDGVQHSACPYAPLRKSLFLAKINKFAEVVEICGGIPYETYLKTPASVVNGYKELKSKIQTYTLEKAKKG